MVTQKPSPRGTDEPRTEMVKMPERLLDAEILLHVLSKYTEYSDDDEQEINADLVFGEIQEAPTVDAVRAVHGKWDADPCGWHCSECGADGRASWHYCQSCGAKMEDKSMKTADDVSKAYHEGYEQGRFDAIADIPHGIEKGYSVVAVVRCGECISHGTLTNGKLFCGKRFTGVYGEYHVVKPDDYCSYGKRREK